MIIGISGKAQSGKDTIGKIIQYLTTKLRHSYHFEDFINPNVNYSYNDTSFPNHGSIWQIHKFADPVKDIVCILTGCTRDQLEDIDFKNSKLPDEWIRYGYADGFMRDVNGSPIMNNVQCDKERYEIELKTNWQTAYKSHLTYRQLLQTIGTDMFRAKLHEDTWINALMSNYKLEGAVESEEKWASDGGYYSTPSYKGKYPNWIITDIRFPNELKAIEDRGGFVIRVNRFDITGQGKLNPHTSETALDDYSFKYTIDNYGTIEELISKVKDILIKERIL